MRKWISEGSTEKVFSRKVLQIRVLQKSSPDKVLQKRLYRKGFIFRVSVELKEAKFRTEALKQKGSLKFSQQDFCTCSLVVSLVGILSEDTRRILQLHVSSFWKNQEVQQNRKDVRGICCLHQKDLYEVYLFW